MIMHPFSAFISMAPPPATLPVEERHEPEEVRINSKNTKQI